MNVGTRMDILKINNSLLREPIEPLIGEVFQYGGKFVRCFPNEQAPKDPETGRRVSCLHCAFYTRDCWGLICCKSRRTDGQDTWFDYVDDIRPDMKLRYYGRVFRIKPDKFGSHIERDKILAEFGKVPEHCTLGVELCGEVPPIPQRVIDEFQQMQHDKLAVEKL